MDNLWTRWIQLAENRGETTWVVYAGMRVVLACLSVLLCDVDHIGFLCLSIAPMFPSPIPLGQLLGKVRLC